MALTTLPPSARVPGVEIEPGDSLPYLELNQPPDIEHLVTEDDSPVDNIFSAKQQRLLVSSLYDSWSPSRPFLADANVGLFYTPRQPPVVPDAFLSLDVQVGPEWWEKRNRSYFFWELGKPPEVAVEIVSNAEGGEDTEKLVHYAGMGVLFYVIYDPLQELSRRKLSIYRLGERGYRRQTGPHFFPEVGLGMTLWEGVYQDMNMTWLRWCDAESRVLPTGAERAEQERQRAERLVAQLRALGIEPEA